MSRSVKILFYFLFLSLALSNCRDKELDEFYARPESLAAPIYQQLDSLGNFKHLLKCIDKAGYKNTLSKAGYFTMFAANDAAFEKFFQENGYGGVADIDTSTARKIVTYSLVYNAFSRDRLVDYQSSAGWVANNAYKRRTAYYVGVYDDIANGNDPNIPAGQKMKVTASNRNGFYIFGDNNNKYIPYFIDRYFNAKNLTSNDYNYFYPTTQYTGFNVDGARVVTPDIFAENGYIHVLDKVIMPLPSIDEYVKVKPEYSKFRALLEKYGVYYLTHPEVTKRYQVLTGSSDPVYVKFYNSILAFSPNNENFLKEVNADNDGQYSGWTIFIPDNETFDEYVNRVLFEHYTSFETMPAEIVNDFLNAHMWKSTVWPSQFKISPNSQGEEARFDPASNIIEAKVLSNGMFYGTNKVQEADVFHSVYGRVYLDPKYSMMKRLLSDLKATIISPYTKFALFMMSDDALKKAGYSYDAANNRWLFKGFQTDAAANLKRLVDLHIAETPQNELSNLAGSGIAETYGGEYIKFSGNTVFAAGNVDSSKVINIESSIDVSNGKVYYINEILQFPAKSIGMKIKELGDKAVKPYNRFYRYLINSSMVSITKASNNIDTANISINGVSSGSFYTFFIPSNASIQAAITAGLLPSSDNPATVPEKDLIVSFLQFHILPKFTIVPDGKKDGYLASMYKTVSDEQKYLKITNTVNNLQIVDYKSRTANVLLNSSSNVLSNRAVIHEIDTYLDYRK